MIAGPGPGNRLVWGKEDSLASNPLYVAEVAVKCLRCGIAFKSRQLPVLIDTGRRNSELRQDFKGVLPQLEPYAILTCPGCGKADWSHNFAITEEQAIMSQAKSAYHLQFRSAALDAEREGRSMYDVGMLYLHAAWCADDDNAQPQAGEYRRLAASSFRKCLEDGSCPADNKVEIEYLIGELLRRAGEFAEARSHLNDVLSRLTSRYALMARKLMKLSDQENASPIDFDT